MPMSMNCSSVELIIAIIEKVNTTSLRSKMAEDTRTSFNKKTPSYPNTFTFDGITLTIKFPLLLQQ